MSEQDDFEPTQAQPARLSAAGTARPGTSPLLADFVADGLKTVSKQEYEARLKICDACDQRRGNRCLVCGCRLSLKARGRAFQCPLGKWPAVDASQI